MHYNKLRINTKLKSQIIPSFSLLLLLLRLQKQVEEGAPADLFISASNKWMKYLSDKNLTVKETEKVIAGNELVLIAPAKSAANSVDIVKGEWIKGLKDSYLSVGDPAHVPAGQYAEESLNEI